MSSEIELIVCRRCNEVISLEQGACPHCGTTIRGKMYYVVVAVGALMMGATVLNPGELLSFGVLGLILAGIGVFFLWDKRRRIELASDRDSDTDDSE